MENKYTLRFKYHEDEFIRAQKEHFISNRRLIIDSLVAIGLIAIALYLIFSNEVTLINSFFLFIGIVYVFVLLFRMYVSPKLWFSRNSKYHEEYILEFADGLIKFTAGENHSTLRWSYYNKIKETKEFIFLYYSKEGFTIIPKRVFKESGDLNGFLDLINLKIVKND